MKRIATLSDIDAILGIKSAARQQYRTIGLVLPPTGAEARELLRRHIAEGRTWVSLVEAEIAAYLIVERLEESLHIEQVTVHPRYAGQRIGASMINLAFELAARQKLQKVTLTTFADVPWNGPYYQRLGFTIIPEERLTLRLKELLQAEKDSNRTGLARVAMTRSLIVPS